MKADSLKKCIAYFVMGISGILLIPTGILLLSIYLIWKTANEWGLPLIHYNEIYWK